MFRSLDASRIAETAERLGKRISERFPGSGLSGVAESLRDEVNTATATARFTAFELARYLDYCSEMLSIISKVAALYVQKFDDAVTLAAVNEVEQLTGSLSQKLWLKIDLLERVAPLAGQAAR